MDALQRTGWRAWRRSRPFWAGVWTLLAGAELLLTQLAPFGVVVHIGATGMAGYAVAVVMMLCGLLLWFSPQPRVFYACLILLLSLASWITANLGGFFVGLLLGIVGGSLALTWTTEPRRGRVKRSRHRTVTAPKPG